MKLKPEQLENRHLMAMMKYTCEYIGGDSWGQYESLDEHWVLEATKIDERSCDRKMGNFTCEFTPNTFFENIRFSLGL